MKSVSDGLPSARFLATAPIRLVFAGELQKALKTRDQKSGAEREIERPNGCDSRAQPDHGLFEYNAPRPPVRSPCRLSSPFRLRPRSGSREE
jgi:hypothetical protein